MPLAIEHYLCDLVIERVNRLSQPFLQLVIYEVGLVSPTLKTFGNEIVRKSLEFLVRCLHLVILGVEKH